MLTQEEKTKYIAFISEYGALVKKHGLYVASYNDCDAPWVLNLGGDGWETTPQEIMTHLIRVSGVAE